MKYRTLLLILPMIGLLAGCQKPGPIDLVSGDTQPLPIVLPPSAISSSLFSTADLDSERYFPTLETKAFGNLVIEGAEYDSPSEHHEAAAAVAVFFNPLAPVVVGPDTGFKTLDPGTISVDQLSLRPAPQQFRDTTVGTRYLLYNQDGTGGKGFTFDGARDYEWASTGSAQLASVNVKIRTPEKLHVTSPDVRRILRTSNDLTVRWTGGGDTVRVYVRAIEGRTPDKILLRMLVTQNIGHIIIRKELLNLLPHDQSNFLFTFSSSKTSRVTVPGFAGDVLVQAVTSHNLALQVSP